MKIIKKILYAIVILILVMIGYLNYEAHFSRKARIGKKNIANAVDIKIGMSKNNVIKIMGNPDTTIDGRDCYITNDDSDPYIEFSFDSLEKIVTVTGRISGR